MPKNLINLQNRVFNNPLLITESYAKVIMGALADRMDIGSLITDDDEFTASELRAEAQAFKFGTPEKQAKPYRVINGNAMIPVSGTLVHKTGYLRPYSGMTGYDGIKANLDIALSDDDVDNITFVMDSPGGEVSGCFELSDYIYSKRGNKQMTALVDDMACSACYAVASACDTIIASENARVGSIGVITSHVSYEKALEDDGVKVTLITAGKHKADGNPYEDLPDEVLQRIQTDIDRVYGMFVSRVSRNRGLSEDAVKATEALVFSGVDGKEKGLVDSVESAITFVENLSSGDGGNTTKMESSEMSQESNQNPQEMVAAAITGERKRISAILTSANAEGRADLAKHIACETDLSVEQANVMLATSPKAETKDKVTGDSGFQETLANATAEEAGKDDIADDAGETDDIGAMLALSGKKDLARVGG